MLAVRRRAADIIPDEHRFDCDALLRGQLVEVRGEPLGLGMLVRQIAPHWAGRLVARLDRVATVLLITLAVLALIDVWHTVVDAGLYATLAIFVTTALVLACGHVLGGPDPATRTALAIVSAARNPGLALVVATVNGAAPGTIATVLAYLVVSALTVVPYLIWRMYGDRRIIERHWNAMTKWMDWLERTNPDGLRVNELGNNYGDWLCIPSDTRFRVHSPMKTR